MQQQSEHAKMLPASWIWVCAGCSFAIVLTAIAGLVWGVAALQRLVTADSPRATLEAQAPPERVPGGTLRTYTSDQHLLIIHSHAWRDNDRLTYGATDAPTPGTIMRWFGPGAWTPSWDEKRAKEQAGRLMGALFSAPLRQLDLITGACTDLVPPREGTTLGAVAWNSQGERAAVELWSLSDVMEDVWSPGVLYLVSPGEKPGWTRLTIGSNPQWSPDGRWIAFMRFGEDQRGQWVIAPDGTGELQASSELGKPWGWALSEGTCTGLYVRVRVPNGDGDLPWVIRRVSLPGGKSETIRLHGETERLGALSADERGFTRADETPDGETVTWVGAVNLPTGGIRWLRKDLPGRWSCVGELLGGKALLLRPDSGPAEAETRVSESADAEPDDVSGPATDTFGQFDTDAECSGPGILSALDGGMTALPEFEPLVEISPDGDRVMGVLEMQRRLWGLMPMPEAAILVLDLTHPDEVLYSATD